MKHLLRQFFSSSAQSQDASSFMDARLRSVLIAVATAQFLLPFMVAGVIPLLPSIGRDLHAGAMELGLIGAVYSLSLSIFHLVSGRIGDMIGRRRLFLTGLVIFLLGAAATPFAPNMPIFLGLRFVQAVGTACMNTSALAILISCAPPAVRGRVLGISSIGVFAGISCGPAVGGFIATTLSWHWLFICVLPVGVIAWYLMAFKVQGDWVNEPDKPFDWKGAITYAFGIMALACGATMALEGEWALWLAAGGIAGLGLFAWLERHAEAPILDMHFLAHNRAFLCNILISLLSNSTIMGVTFYYSLYLQTALGLSVGQTGLVLSVQPVIQLVLAPIAGKMADSRGPVRIATFGLVLICLGLTASLQLTATSSTLDMMPILLLFGAGLAFFGAPNATAVMSSVDNAHLGQASGVIGTVRTLGMLASTVIFSVTVNLYLGLDPLSEANLPAFLQAMDFDFLIFLMLNLSAIALSLYVLRSRRAKRDMHTS